jgi:hypothetical protein
MVLNSQYILVQVVMRYPKERRAVILGRFSLVSEGVSYNTYINQVICDSPLVNKREMEPVIKIFAENFVSQKYLTSSDIFSFSCESMYIFCIFAKVLKLDWA